MQASTEKAYIELPCMESSTSATEVQLPTMCVNGTLRWDYYDYDTGMNATTTEAILLPIIFSLILCVGVVSYSIVIYVLVRSRTVMTVTNLYLLNLAVSDALFMIFCLPITGSLLVTNFDWQLGWFMCKCINHFMALVTSAAVWTMTAISVDRYYTVVRPMDSKKYRTKKYALLIISGIWLLNMAALLPIAFNSRMMNYWDGTNERSMCIVNFDSAFDAKRFTLIMFLAYYAIPLVVIAVYYGRMMRSLWSNISPRFIQHKACRVLSYRRKVAKMVFVIVVTFALCWLPLHTIYLVINFSSSVQNSHILGAAKSFAHALSYVNSALNPVVYAFMSHNFRQSFWLVFRRKNPRAFRRAREAPEAIAIH